MKEEYKSITMRYDVYRTMKAKADGFDEIVRCSDCAYWNEKGYCRYFNLNQGQFDPTLEAYMPMDGDGYCSRGERK